MIFWMTFVTAFCLLIVWALFGYRYYRLQQRNALGSLSPAWVERWQRGGRP